MNTTHQKYIVALAEAQSITKAAKQLGISQPTLSSWLDNIEAELGVPLVIRSKKCVSLTPAGRIYLEGAQRMLECQERMQGKLAQLHSGPSTECIRIAGTPNGGATVFSRIFSAMKMSYPAVQMRFIEGYNQTSIDLVRTGDADFAVCSTPDPEITGVDCYVKRKTELVVMAPRNSPIGYDASHLDVDSDFPYIELQQLEELPFLMPGSAMSYYNALVVLFQQAGISPNVIFQSSNTSVLYTMVRGGNGVAVLQRYFFSPSDDVSPYSLNPRLYNFSCIASKTGSRRTPAQEYAYRFLCSNAC